MVDPGTAVMSTVPSPPSPAGAVHVDLRAEAQHLVRGHLPSTGTGIIFGAIFVGIGGYELASYGRSAPPVDLLVAGLLIVLGGLVAALGLRAGFLDPIVSLRADEAGLHLKRRWRSSVDLAWTDHDFDLEFEDPTPDPAVPPENKRHVFFTAAATLYGSIDRSQIGPLFDVARAHGLNVKMWNDRFRAGRQERVVRRIRISPRSG